MSVDVHGAQYHLQLQAWTEAGYSPLETPGFVPLTSEPSTPDDEGEPRHSEVPAAAPSRSGTLRGRLSRHSSASSSGVVAGGKDTASSDKVLMQPSLLHPATLVPVGMATDTLLRTLRKMCLRAQHERNTLDLQHVSFVSEVYAAANPDAPRGGDFAPQQGGAFGKQFGFMPDIYRCVRALGLALFGGGRRPDPAMRVRSGWPSAVGSPNGPPTSSTGRPC